MDRIAELLADLQNLTAEQLTELRGLIDSSWEENDKTDAPATAESVATLTELNAALEAVAGEVTRREQDAAEQTRALEEQRQRRETLSKSPEEDEPTAKDGDKPEGGESPADSAGDAAAAGEKDKAGEGETPTAEVAPTGEPVAATAEADPGGPLVPEAVTASGSPRGTVEGGSMATRMAGNAGRAQPSPEQGAGGGVALVASAGLPHMARGDIFEDELMLGEAIADTLEALRTGRDTRLTHVAHMDWRDRYPEERRLTGDADSNTRKLNAVVGLNSPRVDQSGTLVASGGICLPVNVDYAVPTWSTADRPLRDGLPSYLANRGGLRFVTPPDIGVPSLAGTASGAGLSVGIWTEATDANPAGATKPVWTVACGSEQLVYVNAIPTRVQFGNMESRFAPEQVAANTQQAIAVSAREAELELLTLMYSASFVKEVSIGTQYLGALRDVLAAVDLLKRQYLDSHRIPKTAAFTVVFPAWAMDMFKSDILREAAHDNAGPRDVLQVTDAQIEELFTARGVNIIWTLEGLKNGTYGNVTIGTTQQFPVVTTGNTPQWPGQTSSGAFELVWLLYVEGTYQFLDGGRLDLGVVRDSLLDSTNDYETFVEVFEGIAGRGIDAYGVVQTLYPTGGSAGTVAATSYKE